MFLTLKHLQYQSFNGLSNQFLIHFQDIMQTLLHNFKRLIALAITLLSLPHTSPEFNPFLQKKHGKCSETSA